MQVVILAGGFGTRISEESHLKPKPMIEIGGRPILWHIMKYYSSFGYNDFIICLGYKGYVIKEFFSDYYLHMSDITLDFSKNRQKVQIHNNFAEPWCITLVDTGLNTMTGGRLKRIQDYIRGDRFMLTYGDGVSTVDLNALEEFHKAHGKIATLTAIQPSGRFGMIDINDSTEITSFREKLQTDNGWINGGYMVFESSIFDYIDGDQTVLEKEPLENLATERQLCAYMHNGFWKCMDTQRDKFELESLLEEGKAPWKVWED